ncbi:MAG: DUF5134 domain-containing protein [Pseudonocardiaceae bacterium]
MIESFSLAAVFTVLFGGLAAFQLRRCAALWSHGAVPGQDRAVELAHLLMSLAMIGMVWAWGGPTAWWLQIVVFGLLTVLFVGRAVAARGLASWGYHALAVGAMTWMVVAMPLLGHSIGTGGFGHGHGGAAAVAEPAVTPVGDVPLWAVTVTVALAVVLVVSALVRTVAGARKPAPVPAGAGKPGSVPAASGRHALMSAGMAGMLLVLV